MRALVLLFFASWAIAQDVTRTAEVVLVPIAAVGRGAGRVREVLIDRGRNDGVVPGWRGKAIRIGETGADTGKELGEAEVVAVAAHVSRVRITMSDPTGDGLVRRGDAIELRMRVAWKENRSLLWDLARENIGFRGREEADTLTDFRTLHLAETEELVESVLNRMVATIRDTGGRYASMEELQQPLANGRYKGRSPGRIMVAATRRELDDFLRYVATYSDSYKGRTWRIDETFATWVIQGAPYSANELVELLIDASTPEARAALLAEHREDGPTLCERLYVRSNQLAVKREFEAARRCREIGGEIARAIGDARLLAWNRFCVGYDLSEQQRRSESIAAYREAVDQFLVLPQDNDAIRSGLGSSLRNLGIEYRQAGQLIEALESLREALRLKTEGAEQVAVLLDIGGVLSDQANHIEAIAEYERAEALCRERDARHALSDALTGKAKSLAKLGRNKEAAAVYEDLLKEHIRIGERSSEASTLADIGLQRWSLGEYATALDAYQRALEIRRDQGDTPNIGYLLQSMGRVKINLRRFDEARTHFEEARRVFSAPGDKAILLTDLGELEGMVGNVAEAEKLFDAALRAQREIGNRTGEAYVQWELGDLLAGRYEYERARAAYDAAVLLYTEAGAAGSLAEVLNVRAAVHRTLKAYDLAIQDHEEALRIRRKTGEKSTEAGILMSIGWLYASRLEFDRARENTTAALAIARATSNKLLEARCHRNLGWIWSAEYRSDEALKALRAALALFEDPAEIALTRLRIADVYGAMGRFEDKLTELREALALARRANAPAIEKDALLAMGSTLHTRGDLDAALVEYERARAIVSHDDWTNADTRINLASIYNELGRGSEAIALALEAAEIYEKIRNDWGRGRALNMLAHLYRHNGDLESARVAIEKALPFGAPTGTTSALHGTCGEVLNDIGDYAGALRHFEIALAEARRLDARWSIAEVQLNAARARLHLGQLAEADASLTEALAYFDGAGAKIFVGDVLQEQAAVALARGDPQAAKAAMARGLALAEETGSPHLLWKAHQRMSRAHEASGDLGAAATSRRAAIAALDRIRGGVGNDPRAQAEFLRSRIDVYESMAELLGARIEKEQDKGEKQALIKESLQFIAQARFQILNRDITGAGGTGIKAVDDLLARIERVRTDIARLEQKLQEAHTKGNHALAAELTTLLATNVAKLDELHTNLAAADPDDFGARVKFEPSSLDEDVAALPEGARLVIYFVGIKNLYIWVYDRNGIVVWKQHAISREDLNAMVARFRGLIDEMVRNAGGKKGHGFGPEAEADASNPAWYRNNCTAMRIVLADLHAALIGPIADEVREARPLLIMPYGWLNYLPFEALIGEGDRFLGEQRTIAYFLHHKHLDQSLERLAEPARGGKDVWVAYADPVGKLHSALEEAEEVRALFPTHTVNTQESATATEENLFEKLRDDCTILHFATHGYLKGKTPSSTYIELAPGGDYDGHLLQSEVFAQFKQKIACLKNKRLRLVVLSACETARAQDDPAAEILGMPDKFTKVGAPAVVASLWSVYTYSTSALMVGFYDRLAKGAGVGAALQSARDAMVKDRKRGRYAHPFYWSPFLLFGDWR